jgi:Rrf2 family protein
VKFSAQEEYGLRCLLRLAHEGEGASLSIAELSELEGISAPNVAKIMRLLRQDGFVTSTRGQAGGYSLARPAGEIVVGEVVRALGGRLYDAGFCERHSGKGDAACTRMTDCSLRSIWQQVQEVVDDVLERITIASLLRSENEIAPPASRGIPVRVISDRV